MKKPISIQKIMLTIPDEVRFADLKLRYEGHSVMFDWTPIEKICAESGIDIDLFKKQHQNNVSSLIARWYVAAIAAGEPHNLDADRLVAESLSDDPFIMPPLHGDN